MSLYTNLGNAALQAQNKGQAVLAYHRALALDPEAKAARQNLEHIRAGMPPWVPRPEERAGPRTLSLLLSVSSETRALVAASCFFLGAVCAWLAIRREGGPFRALAFLFGLAFIVAFASNLAMRLAPENTAAVIVAEEAFARSADSALAPLAIPSPLPAGAEVEWLEARAGWARVRLANGRDVWLRSSAVARVEG